MCIVVLPVAQSDTAVAIDGWLDASDLCTHVISAEHASKAPFVANTAVASAGPTQQVPQEHESTPFCFFGYSISRTAVGAQCLSDGIPSHIVVQNDLAQSLHASLDNSNVVAIGLTIDLRAKYIQTVARLADLPSGGLSARNRTGPTARSPNAPGQSVVPTPALADARLDWAGVAFEHRQGYCRSTSACWDIPWSHPPVSHSLAVVCAAALKPEATGADGFESLSARGHLVTHSDNNMRELVGSHRHSIKKGRAVLQSNLWKQHSSCVHRSANASLDDDPTEVNQALFNEPLYGRSGAFSMCDHAFGFDPGFALLQVFRVEGLIAPEYPRGRA